MARNQKQAGSRKAHPVLYAMATVLSLGVLALVFLNIFGTSDPVSSQPLQFSHYVHVEEEGEKCDACHLHYKTSEVAGRPDLGTCTECHDDEPLSDSPEEEKLVAFILEEQNPPWVRHTRVPPHVRFSHLRHVVVGEIDCTECHGDMAKLKEPPTEPPVAIDMNFCLDCHRSETFTINDQSIKEFKRANLEPDLVDNLRYLQGKRFPSAGKILEAVSKRHRAELSETETQQILEHVYPSEAVTVDCAACHI